MFILCLIFKKRVQTFCLEDDGPRHRIATFLPDNGTLTVDGNLIFPENVCPVDLNGSIMTVPLKTDVDFTCRLAGQREKSLLIVRSGVEEKELSPERYALPMVASVGRDSVNTIVYQERLISSSHGRFFLNDNAELCYQDESKNGTVYNGMIIRNSCVKLKNGDEILFPPLLHVLLSGDVLIINRPRGLLSCSLEPVNDSPSEGRMHALVLLTSAGLLVRTDLPEKPVSLEILRSCVRDNCPTSLWPLLSAENVLLEGHTRYPLMTDGSLTDSLQRGNRIFIIP